jgi:hypothetical protein
MAKANYHHARRERERVRKARQQAKLQRRTARDSAPTTSPPQTGARVTTTESAEASEPPQSQSGSERCATGTAHPAGGATRADAAR